MSVLTYISRHLVAVAALLLIASTLLVYAPIKNYQYINWDDNTYVTEKNWVKRDLTWESVRWAMTTMEEANWHPLAWLSHMLDVQLFGLNPAGHHLTNLLLHLANVLLLFAVLQQMTGAVWRSALVAALFALHPLNVESVAWVAERNNVLSTLFLAADHGRLCGVCEKAELGTLSGHDGNLCDGAHGQAHAGDLALCAAAAGLLAPGAAGKGLEGISKAAAQVGGRKATPVYSGGSDQCGDD